jgi:hypothetical protein
MNHNNHKVVNSSSTSRRQYKHASDDLSRSTPDQNNLSQHKYSHTTRLTLKLNSPTSENAKDIILNILGEFVEELVCTDSTGDILPWKTIHRTKSSINKLTKVPKNAKLLQTYLNTFFISQTPDKQFATYPGINN